MSKFNTPSQGVKTVNLAGGQAYQETTKLEFISILLTSFVKDQFYRSEGDTLGRIRELIQGEKDKKFLAKAAVYARTQFGMRSISHVVAGELLSAVQGEEWLKNFIDKVVYRPDDITEITAYYLKNSKPPHKITNAMRKGFRKAVEKFDEYQLAKYRGEGSEISLVDAMRLYHFKDSEAIKKLVYDKLRSTKTFESELSEAGKADDVEQAKSDAWASLVRERKIGYFALLRNLRNIIEQAPDVLPQALELLTDERLIKKSLVLPFRFTTALEEIEKLPQFRDVIVAINRAVDISLSNVPKLPGNSLVVLDVSGSMQGKPIQIGALFSAVLYKALNADFMMFASSASYASANPLDSTLSLARAIERKATGGSTNFHSIFQTANKKYDRIFILSDMQGWVGYDAPTATFNQYRQRTGANPYIYSFDLAGYGTLQFPQERVFAIAGFSDKVFNMIDLLEQDKNALVKTIEAVEL